MNVNESKIFFLSIFVVAAIMNNFSELFSNNIKNQILLFTLPIIWPGLAHGSLDLEIAKNNEFIRRYVSQSIFLFIYLGLIISFFSLWLFFPDIMFLIFLLLSILHFGISDYLGKEKKTKIIEILIRGISVLALPVKFHQSDTLYLFNFFNISMGLETNIILFCDFLFYLLLVLLPIWIYLNYKSIKSENQIIFEFIMIFFSFYYFEPIISFFIYFCFLHSLRHLNNEKKSLQLSYKSLLIKTIPFTLIPIIFMLVLFHYKIIDFYQNLYFILIGLSSLTIPHIILINLMKTNQDNFLK